MMCLEVGAGTNRSYRFAPRAPAGNMVVFLDIEPPGEDVKACGMWVVADAERLPFRPEAFDRVYASHVIEHLGSPASFLGEVYRVLKRGGVLELWTPNFLSANARGDPGHLHVFNIFSLARAGKATGFSIRLPVNAGSRLPKPLRRVLSIAINIFLDELHVIMRK